MRDLLTDVRYARRRLRATPAFSVTAVLTLALGIGTTTAVFGVVDALTSRPVGGLNVDGAYAVTLRETSSTKRIEIPWSAARALHRRASEQGVRVAIQAGYWTPHAKAADRTEQNLAAAAIGGDFAAVYGLRAQVGRWLTAEDDAISGAYAAVISDRLWREWYGARPDIIDRDAIALRFGSRTPTTTVRIVGVATPGFRGLTPQTSFSDVWISHAAVRDGYAGVQGIDQFGTHTIVRPPPQVPVPASAAAIKAIIAGVMPALDRDSTIVALTPVRKTFELQSLSPLRAAALGVSLLVLVAACANLANMLLARGAHRAGEVAIRLALGASRLRIARVFVAEVALIAGTAAAAGIALAVAGLRIFANAVPTLSVAPGVTLTPDLSLSVRMLGYAVAVAAGASVVVGLIAAWRGSAGSPWRTFAAAGAGAASPRARLLRTAMVSVQVTVALVIVMAAGLYLETMIVKLVERGLFGRRLNYDASHVVAGRVDLARHDYTEAHGRYVLDRVLEEVRRLPDVEHAALASGLPGALRPLAPRETYLVLDDTVAPLGGHPGRGAAEYLAVSPGFLATIGLPIRRGRDFQHADGHGAERVAILSSRAAELLWPGQDPIGRRIAGPANMLRTGDWTTVIGIVDEPVTPNQLAPYSAGAQFAFVPFAQHYTPMASIVLRTSRPEAMADPLRRAVRAIDPEVALLDVNTVESTVLAWIGPMRAATALAGALAGLALGIAALGVYGVMAFLTSTRTREFGVRVALGATPRQLTKLVLDDALRIVLIGLLPGVLLASWGSRYLESRAFGIMPNSITNWVVVPIVVLFAGIVAAYLPARRASRADPTLTLRAE